MKITFVYNSFWMGVYKDGILVYQNDYVECVDALKSILTAVGILEQDIGTIEISDQEYDNYFESVGYPKFLETLHKKVGKR